MKAAILEEFGAPLAAEVIGPSDVLVMNGA